MILNLQKRGHPLTHICTNHREQRPSSAISDLLHLFLAGPLVLCSSAFPPASGPDSAGAAGPSSSPEVSDALNSDSWPDPPTPY